MCREHAVRCVCTQIIICIQVHKVAQLRREGKKENPHTPIHRTAIWHRIYMYMYIVHVHVEKGGRGD